MFFFYLWQSARTWFLHHSPYCVWLSHFIATHPPPSQESKLWQPIWYAWCYHVAFYHGRTCLCYSIAGISKPTPNTSYIPILRRVCFIFGAFACGLLLLILVPPFGWLILSLCACTSAKLLYDSYEQILKCFQHIFQSINLYTSQEFNILCGWFHNSFQSLCQAGSRAFNRYSMPTANSTEQQGLEMVVIGVPTTNSTEQQIS